MTSLSGSKLSLPTSTFVDWTGNRVTCRDWSLTLKEGLTVYRDASFSADTTSAAVKRVADVRTLRAIQFPEDAAPWPIRFAQNHT